MKLLFILLFISFSVHAKNYSMRKCVLLPISDSVGGPIGFKVFERVETYLRESNWCELKSSSSLINIFQKYRENLPQHLKNKDVLKVVADKVGAGSLIRVSLVNEINSIDVYMDIIGDNGEDLIFSEKTVITKTDHEFISSQIESWLDIYSKTIPYDGLVSGILGDQVTIEVGKSYPIQLGQEFVLKRKLSIKKHPLLKKIVEWETVNVGSGKIYNVSEQQALGKIKVYFEGKNLLIGDWVRLEEKKEDSTLDKLRDKPLDAISFGKLGLASAYLTFSSASASASMGETNRMTGFLVGIDLRAEAWITRNYFASLNIAKNTGSLKKSSGNPSVSKLDTSNSHAKALGGYKYLPLGFFYGPQIDLFAGYANYTFGVENSEADGFGETSFSGILLGVASNFPLNREYRIAVRADFLPFPSFKDEEGVYSGTKSESLLQLEFGVKYQYTELMTFDALMEMTSAKATFSGGTTSSVSYRDTQLKFGTSFNF